jgi:hypothetical protein
MTPPPLPRPEDLLLIRRRDFLKKATGVVAAFSLGGLSACGDDDFDGPSADAYPVWVAQRVYGVVRHNVTKDPIPGASVTLTMGFDLDNMFNMGSQETNSVGAFDFVRAEETGEPADYWRFMWPEPVPVRVYIRLNVLHPSFWPQYPRQQFTRTPSKEKPDRQFNIYTFQFIVNMPQVTE